MSEVVLVCAAHPDDEVLGCGGTIARHARAGDIVHVALLTRGILSRTAAAADTAAATRDVTELELAAQRANARLGVKTVTFADFPDNALDTTALLAVAKFIEAQVEQHQPGIVYTHDGGDLNVDHCRCSEAVAIACRPLPDAPVAALYAFEVASSTHWRPNTPFTPNHFVDISETLEAKLDALREYGSEMRAPPHARSLQALEALARWRGSTVGLDAAEAFVLGRSIHKKVGRPPR